MTARTRQRMAHGRAAFEAQTNACGPKPVFDSQLMHHWTLHVSFDTAHAFMLVSLAMRSVLRPDLCAKGLRAASFTEVAKAVSGSIRKTDVATARDFDRIAVLLPQSDLATARGIAQSVQMACRQISRGLDDALTVFHWPCGGGRQPARERRGSRGGRRAVRRQRTAANRGSRPAAWRRPCATDRRTLPWRGETGLTPAGWIESGYPLHELLADDHEQAVANAAAHAFAPAG
jgi:hypothetical protein